MMLVGQTLGHYQLTHSLGQGGMGDVYLAQDMHVNRRVAIKVIKSDALLSQDPSIAQGALHLFQREAAAIARLNHPNILPLLEYGECQVQNITIVYIVMPFCPEGSFDGWLLQRPANNLSPHEVAPLLLNMAEALQCAHDNGIIHRDIKPANFLLRSRGNTGMPDLLLADFGIASIMDTTTTIKAFATTGQVIRGTPTYMPPEQWNGNPVPATDQYALAIMAYQLLTSMPPFHGNQTALAHQHHNVLPQPPSTINPGIPQSLDAVILKALSKRPEERFPSIIAFAQAFQAALLQKAPSTKISPHHTTMALLPQGTYNEKRHTSAAIRIIMLLLSIIGSCLFFLSPFYTIIPANPLPNEIAILVGFGLIVLNLLLVFIQSIQLEQWLWSILLWVLGPLAGTIYNLIGPISRGKSKPPMNEELVLFISVLSLMVAGSAIVGEGVGYFYYARYAEQTIERGMQSRVHAVDATKNPDSYPPYPAQFVFADPLFDSTQTYPPYPWHRDYSSSDVTQAQCQFTKTALDVISTGQNSYSYCFYRSAEYSNSSTIIASALGISGDNIYDSTYGNFVFEVHTTIIKGNVGGIVFRSSSNSSYGNPENYVFYVDQDGTYGLDTHDQQGHVSNLYNSSSSVIKTGLGQTNTIAVVALGSSIGLYVNGQLLQKITDNAHTSGYFGVITSNTGEVLYSNARLWSW